MNGQDGTREPASRGAHNSSGSFGHVGRDPPGLIAGDYPIGLSWALLLLLSPKAAYLGVRQWSGSSGKHR
jgi:hypothetical protein